MAGALPFALVLESPSSSSGLMLVCLFGFKGRMSTLRSQATVMSSTNIKGHVQKEIGSFGGLI